MPKEKEKQVAKKKRGPKKITQYKLEIFARLLAEGYTQKDAYKKIRPGVTDSTALQMGSRLSKKQEVIEAMANMRPEYLSEIHEIATMPIELAITSGVLPTKLKANQDLLDRTGTFVEKKTTIEHVRSDAVANNGDSVSMEDYESAIEGEIVS